MLGGEESRKLYGKLRVRLRDDAEALAFAASLKGSEKKRLLAALQVSFCSQRTWGSRGLW